MAQQSVITDREGRNQGFFIDFYEYHSIATIDYSPIEDPSPPISTSELGMIEKNGFLVRPNADGDVYGITLYDYLRNIDKTTQKPCLTNLVPEPFDGLAHTWIECRFVKVYSHTDAHYASTPTAITIGVTI
jgi:hypothetical protein